MSGRAANVTNRLDIDTLTFRIPLAQKRELQAKLLMEGSNFTDFATVLALAHLRGQRIVVDGKPLGDLLREQAKRRKS